MNTFFKEDQPIVLKERKAVKVAWIDEASILTEHKDTTPAKPANPFEYIFG
ncbi:MAG: hypothetical protein MJZ02_00885 [Paludibacteraceae bacterium]|nr:hypothetical protein [Paludibacteraceae bacterium]